VPFAGRGAAPLRELELLVESGLTRPQALRAATLEDARFLRLDRDIGSLEPGKRADLIVLRGNPADDISAVRRLERDGRRSVDRDAEVPGVLDAAAGGQRAASFRAPWPLKTRRR